MNRDNTPEFNPAVRDSKCEVVPDDSSRLSAMQLGNGVDLADIADKIVAELRDDRVVLIENVQPEDADRLMGDVAERFDLLNELKIQSTFATVAGHRENIGKYYMTVNKRMNYECIPPHSEGTYGTNIQLASFYSYENTTDGGETILLNLNQDSPMWDILHAVKAKIDLCGKKLSATEIATLKMRYQIKIPEDILSAEDKVLGEQKSPIPGIKLFNSLTKLKKIHSRILRRDLNVYWDNVSSVDFDSRDEYLRLLRDCGLLKEPIAGVDVRQLDNAYNRRVWSSGVSYESLFKSKIVRKLGAGDFIIQNNLTWTHSTSNWTPYSGTRMVAAAFA